MLRSFKQLHNHLQGLSGVRLYGRAVVLLALNEAVFEQLLPWVERVCDRMNDIGKAAGVPSIPGSHDELIVLESEQDLVDWAAKQQ